MVNGEVFEDSAAWTRKEFALAHLRRDVAVVTGRWKWKLPERRRILLVWKVVRVAMPGDGSVFDAGIICAER